jgi:predicted nucleic acid-binding Zn ribbon protein
MHPIQRFSSGVVAEVIRRQPASRERTAFAWQLAVGPAIARSTTVDVVDGVLRVVARDAQWGREVRRAAGTILPRMQHLLGAQPVNTLEVVESGVRP